MPPTQFDLALGSCPDHSVVGARTTVTTDHPPSPEPFAQVLVDRTFKLLATLVAWSGLTHKELSLRIGRSATYVGGILRGKIPLKLRDFMAILCELEVTPDDFFLAVVLDGIRTRGRPEELIFAAQRFRLMAKVDLDLTDSPESR